MKNLQIGFLFLILFCFFRPLALINIKILIGGLNAFELFAIIFSYLLLFSIALNFKKINLDLISISILFFCYYCFISIAWGSQIRTVLQVTLPFILYFAVRVMVNESKQIKLILTVLIISYCLPIVGSAFQIIQGSSIGHVEYITGIERHLGMYMKIHALSYAMFFFSVLFYMYVVVNQLKNKQIKWILLVLLIVSFFCLFKSYARSAYIGLVLFWVVSLWGFNKKYFYFVLTFSLIVGSLYLTSLEQIFFKTKEFDINVATSGRIYIWEHNINLFLDSDIDSKLIGHGLGVGTTKVVGSANEIWSSHNDFLHALMGLGSIGLVLYILIYLILLKDIYFSNLEKRTKYFYYGTILSVIAMNFGSGVTLFQVGISQQFWMVIGLFYVYRDFSTSYKTNSEFISKPLFGHS